MKKGRKFTVIVLVVVFVIGLFGNSDCFRMKVVHAARTGFHVKGIRLYDSNGNKFVMRGVNFPHAWFTDKYKTAIPAIARKGFNSVRIVLADGQVYSKTSLNEIKSLIDICKKNKMIAVLEVHDVTGSDSLDKLNQTVEYWKEMKSALIGNEKYVILNIANEWYGTWDDGNNWKNGYVSAVKSLRDAGIKNTFMIDCPGWGQYPRAILDYGHEVLNADYLKNTMFSIHMYEYAGGNPSVIESNINNVLDKNLCVAIGEFGGYHTNGDVDEDAIMRHCQRKGVGWLAWSWHGNNSDLKYLDLANDWEGKSLTDFGKRVINGADGVSTTSRTCTVFKKK